MQADSFDVAPEIRGLPLASRSRRVLAMLLDLALIAAPSLAIRNPFVPAGVLRRPCFTDTAAAGRVHAGREIEAWCGAVPAPL